MITDSSNALEIPVESADETMLEAIEDDLLDDALIADVVSGVAAELNPMSGTLSDSRSALEGAVRGFDREIEKLTFAIASGVLSEAVVDALRDREDRRRRTREQLELLNARTSGIVLPEPDQLERRVRALLADWRRLLRNNVPQARQILSKLLHGRVAFTPEEKNGVAGYRLTGRGSFVKLLQAAVPGLARPFIQEISEEQGFRALKAGPPQVVASPDVPTWNQIQPFIQQMATLRESIGRAA